MANFFVTLLQHRSTTRCRPFHSLDAQGGTARRKTNHRARTLLEIEITFIFSHFVEDVWASVGVVCVCLGMHVCVCVCAQSPAQ